MVLPPAKAHSQTSRTVNWLAMTLVVHLPDDLARRVSAIAAERGVDAEQVAVEAIEAQLPAKYSLPFTGVGRSGRGDLSSRIKELRHEVAQERLADE